MTPEAQRIAIAEACGWVQRIYGVWGTPNKPSDRYGIKDKVWDDENDLPDYLNDLNAMHEAEAWLAEGQWPEYREHLRTIVLGPVRLLSQYCKADIHATAAQRAEAFLKTLNLYQP